MTVTLWAGHSLNLIQIVMLISTGNQRQCLPLLIEERITGFESQFLKLNFQKIDQELTKLGIN